MSYRYTYLPGSTSFILCCLALTGMVAGCTARPLPLYDGKGDTTADAREQVHDTVPAIQTDQDVYVLKYVPDQSVALDALQIPRQVRVVIHATYTNHLSDTVLVRWFRRDEPHFHLVKRTGETWQSTYHPVPVGEEYLAIAPGHSHTFTVVADHYLGRSIDPQFMIGNRTARVEEIPGEYRLIFSVLKKSTDPHRLGERVPAHARISNVFRIVGASP